MSRAKIQMAEAISSGAFDEVRSLTQKITEFEAQEKELMLSLMTTKDDDSAAASPSTAPSTPATLLPPAAAQPLSMLQPSASFRSPPAMPSVVMQSLGHPESNSSAFYGSARCCAFPAGMCPYLCLRCPSGSVGHSALPP